VGVSIDEFRKAGFVAVRGAVAPEIVRDCVVAIETAVRAAGTELADPSTWTRPVVRVPCPEGPAFAAAGTSPPLWDAYRAARTCAPSSGRSCRLSRRPGPQIHRVNER
jgi:hypothetical protein